MQLRASRAVHSTMRTLHRLVLVVLCTLFALAAAPRAHADEWDALGDGAIVLLRHATAPGIGDPPGFRLDDCATQRNLDARGRDEARAIGAAFAERRVAVGAVRSSRWCRAHETAALAFPGRVVDAPDFDSFFDDARDEPARTASARAALLAWTGPGVLVVVTHQVNITALTGVVPAAGEGVLVRRRGSALDVVGRLRVPREAGRTSESRSGS